LSRQWNRQLRAVFKLNWCCWKRLDHLRRQLCIMTVASTAAVKCIRSNILLDDLTCTLHGQGDAGGRAPRR
jgi:hypothetical protein